MATFGSWVEAVPDIELRFESLAGDDERIAVCIGGYGHAADGGGDDGVRPGRCHHRCAATGRHGRSCSTTMSEALARYDELLAAGDRRALPQRPAS